MSAPAPDLARLRPCSWVACAAQLLLLLAALRHHYVWGESERWPWLLPLLNTGEALAVLLAAGLSAFAWWRAMGKAEAVAPPLRRLVWLSVPLLLLAVVVPPFLTTDPIDYVVRGRVLAVHGANPYVTVATEFPDDPFLQFGDKAWKSFPLPYGPVLANVQGAAAWLAHQLPLPPRGELIVALGLLKLLFAGSLLFAATCLARVAAASGGAAAAARTFVAVAWNPLLLVEGVANAHNEPLLVAFVAAAVLAAHRLQWARGAVLLGLSVLTKVTPVVLGPLLLVRALRTGGLRALLLGGLVVVGLGGLFYLQFFRADGAFDVLRRQGELSGASLAWAGDQLTGAGVGPFVWLGRGVVVLVVALGMWRLWRPATSSSRAFSSTTRPSPSSTASPASPAAPGPIPPAAPGSPSPAEPLVAPAATALAALACGGAALFGVWYHCWWIPLALLGRRTFVARFAIAASCTSLLAYLPWTFARRLDAPAQWCNVVFAVLLPLLIASWPPRRTSNPEVWSSGVA